MRVLLICLCLASSSAWSNEEPISAESLSFDDENYAASLVGNVIYFDEEQTLLNEISSYVLEVFGKWLLAHEDYDIVVGGHASLEGSGDYQWAMAARRASLVAHFFISMGVSEERIIFANYGKVKEVSRKADAQFVRANNRVELTLRSD